jgi:hypothetical protein
MIYILILYGFISLISWVITRAMTKGGGKSESKSVNKRKRR